MKMNAQKMKKSFMENFIFLCSDKRNMAISFILFSWYSYTITFKWVSCQEK